MDQQILKIGIVGANWGINHVEAWRRLPNVEVSANCTSRPETARETALRHDIPAAYSNALDMIADPTIDVIDVTPRPSIRTPIALAALKKGKHVIQPLPFADTFAHACELVSETRRSGLVAMIESLHQYKQRAQSVPLNRL